MKIEKLIIYGFGKHEQVTVDLGPGINVLYGLNEAGKTTIQQFILHILFGFPQKNSALLRYEPKSGGKYGGQVHVQDERYGKCVVERVQGKSAGDVTVHFEDGKKGGEAELNLLLRQYDRHSFESIFSFSLLQLQGFEKMDEDELSRTLLASGTTGVDTLVQLEKKLEKEQGELFKKSGKVPKLNVKMAELRELEVELKEMQEKIDDYAPAMERIRTIDERLTALRTEEKKRQQDARKMTIMRQLLPLHEKRQTIILQLEQLHAAYFPADGIRRYETLAGRLTEAETTMQRMAEDLAEMNASMPQQQAAGRLTEVEILLAKEAEWHRWQTAFTLAEEDVGKLTAVKRRLFEGLGIYGEEAEKILLRADVSLQKEERMHELMSSLAESDRQIGYMNRQLVQLENEAADAQQARELIERTAPTQEEMERAQEWPTRRQQLAEAKAYVAFGGQAAEQTLRVLPLISILVAVVLMAIGFIQKDWLVVIIGGLVGGIGIFFYTQKRMPADDAKLREMEEIIAAYAGSERQMEELIERLARYNREKEALHEGTRVLERKQHIVESELDQAYRDRRQTESELKEFLRQYGFDELPSMGIIPELVRMIREVQEVVRELEAAAGQRTMAKEKIAERVGQIEKTLQKSAPEEAIYELLRREFIRLKEEEETIKSLSGAITKQEASLKEVTALVSSLTDKVQTLFAEVGAETEEAFYKAHDQHRESVSLEGQLRDLDAQFAAHDSLELPQGLTEELLATQMAELEKSLSILEVELNTLIQEKAALVNKTEKLLSDGAYARKLQLFEMKKAELAELAKMWSERKAITEAIRRTMRELKEKKLPQVLTVAEKLFRELTGGNYESLIVTEQGYFEVLSTNGLRYPIMELSQATKEQAFIALRLALAASVNETAPFPIVMDDPFVHFDGERLSRMIELLEQLQHKHQFIYFTCHEEMKEKWRQATILNVSDIGNRQGANVV